MVKEAMVETAWHAKMMESPPLASPKNWDQEEESGDIKYLN